MNRLQSSQWRVPRAHPRTSSVLLDWWTPNNRNGDRPHQLQRHASIPHVTEDGIVSARLPSNLQPLANFWCILRTFVSGSFLRRSLRDFFFLLANEAQVLVRCVAEPLASSFTANNSRLCRWTALSFFTLFPYGIIFLQRPWIVLTLDYLNDTYYLFFFNHYYFIGLYQLGFTSCTSFMLLCVFLCFLSRIWINK